MNDTTTGAQTTTAFDQTQPMQELLAKVQGAYTIAGGLTALRSGIAGILATGLGPTITQEGYRTGLDESGTGGAGIVQADIDVPMLAQLYQSLLTDNDEWAEALIANTPIAAEANQDATQSRAAFA